MLGIESGCIPLLKSTLHLLLYVKEKAYALTIEFTVFFFLSSTLFLPIASVVGRHRFQNAGGTFS
jgi:hypothetical protein